MTTPDTTDGLEAGLVRRRWRATLTVTAAAIVLAAGIWAVLRSTDDAEDTAPRPPAGEPGVEPRLPTALPTTPVAGWLPAGMQPEDERVFSTPPLPTIKDSALLTGRGDDAVGVALTAPDANQADLAGRALAPFVGAPYGDEGQPLVSRHEVGPGASVAAAWRRSPWADAAAESAGLAALTTAAPLDLAPAGWRSRAMRVDWAPGVGASASVSYTKPGTTVSVALHSVRGMLPDRDLLAATLADEERVEVRGHRGWFVPLDSPGADSAVLWQEAEGYVGVVVANDVARRDVLRVADEGDWLEPPTPEDMARATTTVVPAPRPLSRPPVLDGPS